MSSKKKEHTDNIYVEFKTLFEEIKTRSQLKSRSMPDENVREYIITETDEPTLKIFFEDGVDDVAERLGALDQMKDYGGTVIYRLSEKETEQGAKRTTNLLKKVFINYLLFEWYRSVGHNGLAKEYLQFYEEYLKQYRNNSTKSSFVTPKYRPYF